LRLEPGVHANPHHGSDLIPPDILARAATCGPEVETPGGLAPPGGRMLDPRTSDVTNVTETVWTRNKSVTRPP